MEPRLKRVSDLFIEGTVVNLGMDPEGGQVLVWVNKLNSFEREEAVRDATVRRAERMAEIGPGTVEGRGVEIEMSLWSDEDLRANIVRGDDDEIYLEALDNLHTDPEFRELEDYVRRAPEMQADEGITDDDPRLRTLADKAQTYSDRVQEAIKEVTDEHLAELSETPRAQLEEVFLEQWRKRRAFDEYMTARRMTEIFLATRDCRATLVETTILPGAPVERNWDHSLCDHSQRLFSERASIRKCPEQVILKIADALNDLTVPPREAGNSVAPASSSGPSEPSSAPEAPSTPSSPVGMHRAAPEI